MDRAAPKTRTSPIVADSKSAATLAQLELDRIERLRENADKTMSTQCEVTASRAAGPPIGVFERYLWVLLGVVVGIGLGRMFPASFRLPGRMIGEKHDIACPSALIGA